MKRDAAAEVQVLDVKTLERIERLVEAFRAEVIDTCCWAARNGRGAEVGARAKIDERGHLKGESHVEPPRRYPV